MTRTGARATASRLAGAGALVAAALASSCTTTSNNTNTPTPLVTPIAPTNTPPPSSTASPTPTWSATVSDTFTPTAFVPSSTALPSATNTVPPTDTPTAPPTATDTVPPTSPTDSRTPTPTSTSTSSATVSVTSTATSSSTMTSTITTTGTPCGPFTCAVSGNCLACPCNGCTPCASCVARSTFLIGETACVDAVGLCQGFAYSAHWVDPGGVTMRAQPACTISTCGFLHDCYLLDPSTTVPGNWCVSILPASGGTPLATCCFQVVFGSPTVTPTRTPIATVPATATGIPATLTYLSTSSFSRTITATATTSPTACWTPACTAFGDDFESGGAGWVATGLWNLVNTGSVSCAVAHTATHSFWYGQVGTCAYDTGVANTGDLTSPAFTVPGGASLRFYSWYETEPGWTFDQRWIDVSVNNGAFTPMTQLGGDPMSAWTCWTFSLAPYAGSSLRVRYRFDTVDAFNNGSLGWFLDDVCVW